MASSSMDQIAASLVARSRTLINKDLQRICKAEGLPSSGVKAQLQQRVTELIDRAVSTNDHVLFNRLQAHFTNDPRSPRPMSSPYGHPASSSNSPAGVPTGAMSSGYQQPPPQQQPYLSYSQQPRPHNLFKESPFFEIRESLLTGFTLEASPSHRQNAQRTILLAESVCARLRADSTLRILLFCASEQPLSQFTRLDVAFPSQIEVRVNNEEVKANYKGLKNKPGSTRPADITGLLRTNQPNWRNTLSITYALTQKASKHEKYNVSVSMVRKFSIDELLKKIKNRNVITKQSVINELKKKANDPDIVVESSVMSLKDPISTLRINTPCRSTLCSHNQCFDGESFLQLQEQAPTWTCPICNKIISFEALAVDEYVQEILDKVSKGTDQVTVEPDGKWSSDKGVAAASRNDYDNDDSDDDLIEVPKYRLPYVKAETVPTPQSLARTPPVPSREASSAPRTGSKRTSEVIDLTLSDDEDTARPRKKVAYSTPNSIPDQVSRYQLSNYGTPNMPVRPSPHLPRGLPPGMPMDPPSVAQGGQPYRNYPPPPPQHNYHGSGTSSYPTYIDSSP